MYNKLLKFILETPSACKDTSSPNNPLSLSDSTRPKKTAKKEEWTVDAVKVLTDAVKEHTNEKGSINWPEINKLFPTRGKMSARSKYGKICRKIITISETQQQPATAISSSSDISIIKTSLPDAGETLDQIHKILSCQGLSNKQLLHLIVCETSKSTYTGKKIKKKFEDGVCYVGEIVSFDGMKYKVVYDDGDVESYTEAQIAELLL
jgi:hypothetical protein